ncbi:hypothetical protein C0991_002230 [Blastosporella zonata]|nr:hypothetical protein C0991_002230 [Blastosporella zonata]
MAGAFAKAIGAKKLILNHIGSRFPAPRFERDHRSAVMSEIERQATEAWGSETRAVAAYDYMTVKIPPTMPKGASSRSDASGSSAHVSAAIQVASNTQAMTMQLHHADPTEGFLYAEKEHSYGSGSRNGNRNKKRRR